MPQVATCKSVPDDLVHCAVTAASQSYLKGAVAQVKGMLYRARQRGHLELDLIVGLWAGDNVPSLSPPQLEQVQEVLECENPDLFKWLTGQETAPADLQANDMFKVLA